MQTSKQDTYNGIRKELRREWKMEKACDAQCQPYTEIIQGRERKTGNPFDLFPEKSPPLVFAKRDERHLERANDLQVLFSIMDDRELAMALYIRRENYYVRMLPKDDLDLVQSECEEQAREVAMQEESERQEAIIVAAKEEKQLRLSTLNSNENKFNGSLQALKAHAENLKTRNHSDAAKVAMTLFTELEKMSKTFFEEAKGQINNDASVDDQLAVFKNFQNSCQNKINEANPILSQHRGWKKVVMNILCAIFGVGVPCIYNKYKMGSFFFHPQTESSKKVESIKDELNRISSSIKSTKRNR